MSEVIDMCKKIKETKLTFVLNPDGLWEKFNKKYEDIVKKEWKEVKFFDDTCKDLHENIELIPSNCGGIYIFVIKTELIPNTHIYIMYIGRAKITQDQNLKKRCKEYLKDNRPKILNMKETWGKNLYIRYLPLDNNSLIDELEEELIKVIVPPCNEKYPEIIRAAMKAAF